MDGDTGDLRERQAAIPALSAPTPTLRFDPLAPTIFHQPWWLDTVSPGGYTETLVETGGRVVGRHVYVVAPVLGPHRLCGMPPLTHFLGPAIDEGRGAACSRVLRRAQITRDLLQRMAPCSGVWQKLHRGTKETLVYQELGFATKVQFTFEIAPAPRDTLWKAMRDKTRNVIRRAQENYVVSPLPDPAVFADLYMENLARRGRTSRHDRALIIAACTAARARQQGEVIAAISPAGKIAASIMYVWDAQAAYYLLSTRDPEAGNGVVSLLLWAAIQDISARGLVFDFEGVADNGSALFFTGFGGEITPRYVVSRYTLGHRVAGRLANPFRKRKVSDSFM
jgi:hypothetical protein